MMAERLPIHFDRDEVARLSAIANTAAIQTGAKGDELDQVMDAIFRTLAAQANRMVLRERERPALRLIASR
ncbi:hypothetical protein [Parafrankia sp. BMG5.11]|uniref:hypothetical protein n=1 Tax=Parafrankia sp. BMG5.11 TaxID=222540 RepID=UPI0010387E79|nr:hypothetical protein [Parafrankia sp. BMG5.11]TCJ39209.1 hypothetical protein E0504_08650 [Parafrankia sp. BMG5.11]